MDNLYENYLVRDPRTNFKNKVALPILQGSNSYTQSLLEANSKSRNEIDFQFTPLSESVQVLRNIMVDYEIEFTTTITSLAGVTDNTNVFAPASNICVQSFPLHRITSYFNGNINNAPFSQNIRNTLTTILQSIDEEDLRQYTTLCPVMSDRYVSYTDIPEGATNSPFSPYTDAYSKKIMPRGAHPISILSVVRTPNAGAANNSLVKLAGDVSFEITWSIKCVEPLLVPPFSYGRVGDEADAFLGVNKIGIKFNLDQNCNRVLSSSLAGSPVFNTTIKEVKSAKLHVQYMALNQTQLVPSRVIQPFVETVDYTYDVTTNIPAGSSIDVNFNNVQLGQIPDRIQISARKPPSTTTALDPDVFLPIPKISVTFNTKSSLLADMTTTELYLMSRRNGMKNVDFYQFQGLAQKENTSYNAGASGTSLNLSLGGGHISLSPVADLSLSNQFLTNGSRGQYNFSFRATVVNNTSSDIPVHQLMVNCLYMKLLETTSGTSRVITPEYSQDQVAKVVEEGIFGDDIPLEKLTGGCCGMSSVVHGGVSKSGGSSVSGGRLMKPSKKFQSKLDELLM